MPVVPLSPDAGPQVVLELIYRLKIRDVMTKAPITALATEPMRAIQYRLRDNGITGLPVVDSGGRLAGIISMDDVITALDTGRIESSVEEFLTRQVIVLEDDMPLAFAVTYFNRYKFGRFPILDREGLLVGIVTASDIVNSLLVAMNEEVERLEARLCDRMAEEGNKVEGQTRLSFPVVHFDFENAGKASAEIKKALKARGMDQQIVRRAAVASYELELNIVIHSLGGTISCLIAKDRLEILAEDEGPGIPDLEDALREGFSTANPWVRSLGFGAGMGLPNVKRVADEFFIDSSPGRGTKVRALIALKQGAKNADSGS